jgi:hypothetical protein
MVVGHIDGEWKVVCFLWIFS